MEDKFIERRIVIGLIVSTEYLHRVRKTWNPKFLKVRVARLLSEWCLEYYDKYNKAPGEEIESILNSKKKKITSEEREDIEDILGSLSEEHKHAAKFNVVYLLDQTVEYMEGVSLKEFASSIDGFIEKGNFSKARDLASSYKAVSNLSDKSVDLSDESIKLAVRAAFTIDRSPLFVYPRQLGDFINSQLIRGGFIAFMGPEKRGKTFQLMDLAIRACRQGLNVVFFQAGDMTLPQQIRRIGVHLAMKSDDARYCGVQMEPVRDCIYNQLDTCTRKERECGFGAFDDKDEDYIRQVVDFDELLIRFREQDQYTPCHNCEDYWTHPWGAPWLEEVDIGPPLTESEAIAAFDEFFIKQNRRFKLSTYPTDSLTVNEMDAQLDIWEREDGFIADVVVVDYVDIMAAPTGVSEFRHQENAKWKGLRGLSQRRVVLVATATQTDADSYNVDTLTMNNYSEDKRKFAHVTAMWGLNQDRKGREKRLGIMRLNEIVIREGAFSSAKQVHVIQALGRGLPSKSSYWK